MSNLGMKLIYYSFTISNYYVLIKINEPCMSLAGHISKEAGEEGTVKDQNGEP